VGRGRCVSSGEGWGVRASCVLPLPICNQPNPPNGKSQCGGRSSARRELPWRRCAKRCERRADPGRRAVRRRCDRGSALSAGGIVVPLRPSGLRHLAKAAPHSARCAAVRAEAERRVPTNSRSLPPSLRLRFAPARFRRGDASISRIFPMRATCCDDRHRRGYMHMCGMAATERKRPLLAAVCAAEPLLGVQSRWARL